MDNQTYISTITVLEERLIFYYDIIEGMKEELAVYKEAYQAMGINHKALQLKFLKAPTENLDREGVEL